MSSDIFLHSDQSTLPEQLPTCDEFALSHSRKLLSIVRDKIESTDGWLSFSHFMEMALYHPGLGYYNGGSTKLGGSGDFVTAPEISVLFGRTLASQVRQIAEQVGTTDVLELGAGSGKLALDLLQELEQQNSIPRHYYILEVSAELRERQQKLFAECAPHLKSHITWLEQLPDQFSGTILANEVLDAIPVHLVMWNGNEIYERGVTWNKDNAIHGLAWEDRPMDNAVLKAVAVALSATINPNQCADFAYLSEINLNARYLLRTLAETLQSGAIILIDYGFGCSEYYHPQRSQGTLMCHYRHRAHSDPFYLPGLQDITSHVDFSALVEVAEEVDLSLLGYTTQAHFLINCGVMDLLAQTPAEVMHDYLPLAGQLQKLVSPAEMGELFKVIAFGKNLSVPLIGFSNGDKSRML